MILNQVLGMTLIALVLVWGMSFFLQARCVMDFYARGLRSVTRGLHQERQRQRPVFGLCGHPLKMEVRLEGGLVEL